MRKVQPQRGSSTGVKITKWFVVAEFAFLLYAYGIYYRLNRSQEFRYKYSKKHPWILNLYYLAGEKLGGLQTRKEDLEYWTQYENSRKES